MRFEEFAKMAKEEFGLTVVQSSSNTATFESLFGVSAEEISKYELPYNVSAQQFGYYEDEAKETIGLKSALHATSFDPNNCLALAA